jgi:two-component system response regulator protein BraR/BceR
MKILIVEDDPVIASAVRDRLESWGYDAKIAPAFDHITELFAEYDPQLVLMDILLPNYNGFYWTGEIRKLSKVPIIFLSSASDNMNIVMAVNMGADDFVPKPFDMDVLLAKIQAVLRRSYDYAGTAALVECRGAMLNKSDMSFSYQGEQIELTKNEFRILETLMENRGSVVSRDSLMIRLWEGDDFVDENTLTVNVARLRRKLEAAGLTDFIRTKKGIGYLIEG